MHPAGRILVAAATMLAAVPCAARAAEIWFAPPDTVTQKNRDFPALFDNPGLWARAAGSTAVFSVTERYLVTAPAAVVQHQLAVLRAHNIRLDVSVEVMTADKKQCGDGIEGMVWPGEPVSNAQKLKALGADVFSFSMDGPFTSGHTMTSGKACRYSIADAAHRLGEVAHQLLGLYPNVKFVDTEPPNAMPLPRWQQELPQWLAAFQQQAGVPLYGWTMDVAWGTNWQQAAKWTAGFVRSRGIRAGLLIDAPGRKGESAVAWTMEAERNACTARAVGVQTDYLVVANWEQMLVPNVPESNPGSLTSIVDWIAGGAPCR